MTGRGRALVAAMRSGWRQCGVTGAMAVLAYVLVLIAVRRAPVGYVAALRESSVLLAAFLGTATSPKAQSAAARSPPASSSPASSSRRRR